MEPIPRTHSNSKSSDQTIAHVLVIPYPIQGHVSPIMKLSHQLAAHGVKVTFLVTESIRTRIIAAMPESREEQRRVRLVSVPDGLETEDEGRVAESLAKVMPAYLENLIKDSNRVEGDRITCVIADVAFGWALEIAGKMGLKSVMFWPSGPGVLGLTLHIPKLIEAGIIDSEGTPKKDEKIQLSPYLPAVSTAEFMWTYPGNPAKQKIMFQCFKSIFQNAKNSSTILCNWFPELDPSGAELIPNILPVGPLLANGKSAGNLRSEDSTCLSWLDKQPAGSVIYVAFGSKPIISQQQFDEFALGLELVGRPFLWTVHGLPNKFPDGFTEKVANQGKIVQWAPQEKVLAHPSVSCFLTHCGWNSIIEGLSMGVPFLCWPHFADQFYNSSCIQDGWKVGLWFSRDENGIITRHEIQKKIDELHSNKNLRANALKLKEIARKSVTEGESLKNLDNFVEQIKH